MNAYSIIPPARADNYHIWSYIAKENEDAANRVEQAIYDACTLVANAPLSGHTRHDLTDRPLRFWTLTRFPNYSIVYKPESPPVLILAVLHGKRSARSILKERH
jgi:plasmid stabilization system protein ParE